MADATTTSIVARFAEFFHLLDTYRALDGLPTESLNAIEPTRIRLIP